MSSSTMSELDQLKALIWEALMASSPIPAERVLDMDDPRWDAYDMYLFEQACCELGLA